MSYADPYAATGPSHFPPQARHQHQYDDSADFNADFNPYSTPALQPRNTLDQNAYEPPVPRQRNDSMFEPPYRDDGPSASVPKGEKDDFDPFAPPPKSTGDLRMWRRDHHGNLWTKGGRGHCVGRFCCFITGVVILLVISILLTMAIFLRPPDITFSGVSLASSGSGSAVVAGTNDLTVNLGIGIGVRNPNFFNVGFKKIEAAIFYPLNGQNTQIGGGSEKNVNFPSNTQTTFSFPFAIDYSTAKDPNGDILVDIATKCGFVPGSAKKQITVHYSLTLSIQILMVTVSPPITGDASFDCPFSLSDIKPLIGSIPALQGILGGGSST